MLESKLQIYDIMTLAEKFTMPYLNCNEKEWKDAYGKLLDFDDMSTKYLENCLSTCKKYFESYIKREGYIHDLNEDIGGGFRKTMEKVDIDLNKLKDEEKEAIIKYILESTGILLKNKMHELEKEIMKRKK